MSCFVFFFLFSYFGIPNPFDSKSTGRLGSRLPGDPKIGKNIFLQNRLLTPKMPKRVPESDSEEEATARERRGSKKKNNVKSAVKAR